MRYIQSVLVVAGVLTVLMGGALLLPTPVNAVTGNVASPDPVGDDPSYRFLDLSHVPDRAERRMLASNGIHLKKYVPGRGWLARMEGRRVQSTPAIVASMRRPQVEEKRSDRVMDAIRADIERRDPLSRDALDTEQDACGWATTRETLDVAIHLYASGGRDAVVDTVRTVDGRMIQEPVRGRIVEARIPRTRDALRTLSSVEEVKWVDCAPAPLETFNDGARETVMANHVQFVDGVNGSNVTVAEWDAGWAGNHRDLSYPGKLVKGDTGHSFHSHSTHVAGTMAGNGTINGSLRGMAPEARIITYEWPDTTDFTELYQETNESVFQYDAVLSQNSWGMASCDNNYDGMSEQYDHLVRGVNVSEPLTVVFAASNDGPSYNTVCEPGGTAKNTLVVGAVNSDTRGIASFSSRGPTDDGRLKPDVSAPGCQSGGEGGIRSTEPGDTYGVKCGTSMAAPTTSGVVALLHEQYMATHGTDPLPATEKAIMIHTANDAGNTGPDYTYGYGIINASAVIDLVERSGEADVIRTGSVSQGGEDGYTLSITNESRITITAVWSDAPGDPSATTQLVNDLDLVVKGPSGTRHYPWTLNESDPSAAADRDRPDRLNNVEQVVVDAPASGQWSITVNGTSVPEGPQSYALIIPEEPFIGIESPGNTTYPQGDLDYNITVSEPITDAVVSIDNGANRSMRNDTALHYVNTSIPALGEGRHNATFWVNTTNGTWKRERIHFTVDLTPPTWKNPVAGSDPHPRDRTNTLAAQGQDGFGLARATLATNESGVWQNKSVYGSPVQLSGAGTWVWANASWRNASVTPGSLVGWRFWFRDRAGNVNATNRSTFTVVSPPAVQTPVVRNGTDAAPRALQVETGESTHADSVLNQTRTFMEPVHAARIEVFSGDNDTLDATVAGYNGSWNDLATQSGGTNAVLLDTTFDPAQYTRLRVTLEDTEGNDDVWYTWRYEARDVPYILPRGTTAVTRANVTDRDGSTDIDRVLLHPRPPGGGGSNRSMINISAIPDGATYQNTTTLASLGTWRMRVYANDTTGFFRTNTTRVEARNGSVSNLTIHDAHGQMDGVLAAGESYTLRLTLQENNGTDLFPVLDGTFNATINGSTYNMTRVTGARWAVNTTFNASSTLGRFDRNVTVRGTSANTVDVTQNVSTTYAVKNATISLVTDGTLLNASDPLNISGRAHLLNGTHTMALANTSVHLALAGVRLKRVDGFETDTLDEYGQEGDAPWNRSNATAVNGSWSARAGDIGNGESSTLARTVRGPRNVTFWWRASSEQGYDVLRFKIDGVEKDAISGDTGWRRKEYRIGAGKHTVTWTYDKDSIISENDDTGYLDDVSVPVQTNGTGHYRHTTTFPDFSAGNHTLTANVTADTGITGFNTTIITQNTISMAGVTAVSTGTGVPYLEPDGLLNLSARIYPPQNSSIDAAWVNITHPSGTGQNTSWTRVPLTNRTLPNVTGRWTAAHNLSNATYGTYTARFHANATNGMTSGSPPRTTYHVQRLRLTEHVNATTLTTGDALRVSGQARLRFNATHTRPVQDVVNIWNDGTRVSGVKESDSCDSGGCNVTFDDSFEQGANLSLDVWGDLNGGSENIDVYLDDTFVGRIDGGEQCAWMQEYLTLNASGNSLVFDASSDVNVCSPILQVNVTALMTSNATGHYELELTPSSGTHTLTANTTNTTSKLSAENTTEVTVNEPESGGGGGDSGSGGGGSGGGGGGGGLTAGLSLSANGTTVYADEEENMTLMVRNNGSLSQFDIGFSFDSDAAATFQAWEEGFDLNPTVANRVPVTVRPDATATSGSYPVTVTATSGSGVSTQDTATLTIKRRLPRISLTTPPASIDVVAGENRTLTFTLRNSGNGTAHTVSFTFTLPGLTSTISPRTASIRPARQQRVTVAVSAPERLIGVHTGTFGYTSREGNGTTRVRVKVQPASNTTKREIERNLTRLRDRFNQVQEEIDSSEAATVTTLLKNASTALDEGDYASAAEAEQAIRDRLSAATTRATEEAGGGGSLLTVALILIAFVGLIGGGIYAYGWMVGGEDGPDIERRLEDIEQTIANRQQYGNGLRNPDEVLETLERAETAVDRGDEEAARQAIEELERLLSGGAPRF